MNKLFILLFFLSSCSSLKNTSCVEFYLGPKNVFCGYDVARLGILMYSYNYPERSIKEKYSKRKYITYSKHRKVYTSYYFKKNIPVDTLSSWLNEMIPIEADKYLGLPRIFILINQADSLMIYRGYEVKYKNQIYGKVSPKMWTFLKKKMPESIKGNWIYNLPSKTNDMNFPRIRKTKKEKSPNPYFIQQK